MVKLSRRTALAGLTTAPLAAARAQAVDFPDRPLRLVVGFPPGGPNDLLARLIAPGIGDRLKRTVVVENRAGANGEIAAAAVAKAPADGSVIMLGSNGSTTIAPALSRNVPYDIRTDFAAVAPVGINPMLLVVRNDLAAAGVPELLALARAQPGKLNSASAGAGGATHLALELFKSMGRVDIVHVPYKGGGPAMADLMAGQVDLYFGGLSTALPHVRAGKMRALGQTLDVRSPAAPDIPTIAEAGLDRDVGHDLAVLFGLGALGVPFRIGCEGVPLLLAIGQRLPGEEIGEFLVGLAHQRGEEAGLLDAVPFPDLQSDGGKAIEQRRQAARQASIDSHFVDHFFLPRSCRRIAARTRFPYGRYDR
ncbi:MAG: tripartite tricarboxylate transporter substrate binding protein [Alphaproteobacteria bacterium]|nr:tripartite tricarboxylate transporter substrate binding protein [Alphaproteobacteria bacterium]